MNTRNYLESKCLTWLRNRGFFLFILIGLNLSCQLVSPKEKEDEANVKKIIDTNINFAQKRIDEGEPEQALAALRPILKNYPENASLLNMVGLTYLALSRPVQAKAFFKRAYKSEKSPTYALNLSSALIMTDSYIEAQKVLNPHIKENKYPHAERLYHNYALAYEKRKLTNKAIHFYNKALNENPSYYLSNFRLGKIYQSLHQKEAARTAFESAHNSCKICFEPLNELCLIYINEGQFAKASDLLRGFLANKEITKEGREQANKLLSLSSKNESH